MLRRIIAVAVLLSPALLPQSAQDIVKQVVRTYANCESYEDEGQATTTYLLGAGQVVVKPFSTHFARRHSRFRFEYTERFPGREQWSRYLILMDGSHLSTWWTAQPHVVHPSSLNEAVVAATGVSASSAYVVPSLLVPALISHHALEQLTDVRIGKRESTEGVKTVKIIARSEPGSREYTYWVGEADRLIRRIEWTEVPSRQYQIRTVLTYSPKINQAIQDSKFVFDPPNATPAK